MYKQSMSYSQIASASVIAKEIEELERAREEEKRKVQHDFIALMEKLNNGQKRSWADMVEEDEANGWKSGWPLSTQKERRNKKVSWAEAVKG